MVRTVVSAILPELVRLAAESVEVVLDDFAVAVGALVLGAYSIAFDFERRAR
jgi:hypothetical protein